MKQTLFIFIGFFILAGFQASETTLKSVNNKAFGAGEYLQYRLHYGWITLGEAEVLIDNDIKRINKRPCYKVDIYGRTVGMADWFGKVDDHWGTFVDTQTILPHISVRNLKEGNYRKNEVTLFDQEKGMVEVKTIDKNTGDYKPSEFFEIAEEARDMIAGYLFMRTLNLNKHKKGDIIIVRGFLEDTFYDLEIIYAGKERIKTKAGKFNTHKMVPILPDNKIFSGENAVTFWFSDDENKIPVKIDANMVVGRAGVELKSYKGLKNKINNY